MKNTYTTQGRRPDQLRALARTSLEKCLIRLEERMEDPNLSTGDLIRVADLLLKYSIGPARGESTMERPTIPLSEMVR